MFASMDAQTPTKDLALEADALDFRQKAGKLGPDADWRPGDAVEYMRTEAPEFRVPEYTGCEYEDLVPDTLDLQDRAALAVNALTEVPDPAADYEAYFWVSFNTSPPSMQHDFDSPMLTVKFMATLPLMRLMSGSRQNEHVDRWWMEMAQRQLGPDGIAYIPTKGRPWAFYQPYSVLFSGLEDIMPERPEPFINVFYCGAFMSALSLYHKRDVGTLWKDTAERMVDGLIDLAVYKDDYAYYAPHVHWTKKGHTNDPSDRGNFWGLEIRKTVLGLTHVYRVTGYQPAMELARKLVNYMVGKCKVFDDQGRFNCRDSDAFGGSDWFRPTEVKRKHFHSHGYALLALLEYAVTAGDCGLIELVRKGYEYAKTEANVEVGYFPETIESYEWMGSELCNVADMVAVGLKLTVAGAGDYWEDVDRWTRNMLTEGQLIHADWIERFAAKHPPSKANRVNTTTDRVAERNIGAFAGFPAANDWVGSSAHGTVHCCTANAAKALYYLWENILSYEAGQLRVNLLLNRASQWADVLSHIPYTGQVDVKVKQAVDLFVRIPAWTDRDSTQCDVNGRAVNIIWEGAYARIGKVGPGQVSLRFRIAERTQTIHVQKQKYTIITKGNEVVAIEPPGTYYPLYQKRHYRQNETRWRKTRRFISDEHICW